jgi:hypothetical protein
MNSQIPEMTPEQKAAYVPHDMPADQVEMLAETRIRKLLLDPTYPKEGAGSFVENHSIKGLGVSYIGPTGKRVIILQEEPS